MDEFLPMATLIGLIISVVNFLLYLKGKNMDGALKIVVVWVAGIAAVLLAARTDYAKSFEFGGVTLDVANTWTQIWIGLTIGGSATVVNEFKKAFDNHDTAEKPALVGPPAP
jgi:ABC-type sulfate transport system permease component